MTLAQHALSQAMHIVSASNGASHYAMSKMCLSLESYRDLGYIEVNNFSGISSMNRGYYLGCNDYFASFPGAYVLLVTLALNCRMLISDD